MDAGMGYEPMLFGLSLLVAHVLATLSLGTRAVLLRHFAQSVNRVDLISALIMGTAVCGMHYTAMFAARFYVGGHRMGAASGLIIEPHLLALSIAFVVIVILGIALIGVLVDQRMVVLSGRLRDSEETLELIVQTVADGIVGIDAAQRITLANAASVAMLGTSLAQLLGANVHTALHSPGGSRVQCSAENCALMQALAESGQQRLPREALHLQNASSVPVQLSITPLAIGGAVITLVDTATLMEIERELIHAKNAAEQATRVKDQLLSNTSHELRTLLLDTGLSEEQRDYADIALQSAHSLLELINDLLDFAKIESGRVELEWIGFDPAALVVDLRKLFAARAAEKEIDLRVEFGADLPKIVLGDPGRLRQILLNLVANAIKFSDRGEVIVTLHARDQSASQVWLDFSVADTGIGIPENRREAIFEAFAQADASTTRRYGGSGLGLSISQNLIQLMGSRIEVASTVGKGSCFRFSLALEPQVEAVVAPQRSPEALRGKRALLLGDSPAHLQRLADHLQQAAVLVQTGVGVEDVLAGLRENAPKSDFVVLDFLTLEGAQSAVQRIRADSGSAQLPLILMMASPKRGDADNARSLGVDGFLPRTENLPELLDLIAILLHHERQGGSAATALVTRHTVAEQHAASRPVVLVAEDNPMNQ